MLRMSDILFDKKTKQEECLMALWTGFIKGYPNHPPGHHHFKGCILKKTKNNPNILTKSQIPAMYNASKGRLHHAINSVEQNYHHRMNHKTGTAYSNRWSHSINTSSVISYSTVSVRSFHVWYVSEDDQSDLHCSIWNELSSSTTFMCRNIFVRHC